MSTTMESSEESGGGGGADAGSFKCHECNSIFKRRDHLGRHMMTQHDENSQRTKCPLKDCDTEMVRRDHLRRHISQVHKVDPSDVLPYSRRKPSLKKSGAFDPLKRFKCVFDGCDAELSRKDHLCRHIKNIHKADPRQVIGHMYKTPRPNSTESPTTGGGGSQITTSTSPGKTKKRGSKKKRDASEDTPTMANHSSDNHHPGHHPHQPHASTLSDYDYGADFDYGGLEGEDDDEATLYLMGEAEDAVVCILCCYPYFPGGGTQPDSLSESFHFHKFLNEILPEDFLEGSFSRSDSLNCLDHLYLCPTCLPLINNAMDKKMMVDEVEMRARQLQRQLLLERRNLQERLAEYSEEMREIESVVRGSDVSCLKGHLRRNLAEGRSFENSLVLLLRKGIVFGTPRLETRSKALATKFGTKSAFGDEEVTTELSTCSEAGSVNGNNYSADKNLAEDSLPNQNKSMDLSQNVPENSHMSHQSKLSPSGSSESADFDDEVEISKSKSALDVKQGKSVNRKKRKRRKKERLINGMDASWTDFKKMLVKTARKGCRKQGSFHSSSSSSETDVPNPRHNFRLKYIPETDSFAVGHVPLLVNETETFLECSKCSFRVAQKALSSSPKEKISLLMEQHVHRKHLRVRNAVPEVI